MICPYSLLAHLDWDKSMADKHGQGKIKVKSTVQYGTLRVAVRRLTSDEQGLERVEQGLAGSQSLKTMS